MARYKIPKPPKFKPQKGKPFSPEWLRERDWLQDRLKTIVHRTEWVVIRLESAVEQLISRANALQTELFEMIRKQKADKISGHGRRRQKRRLRTAARVKEPAHGRARAKARA